MSELPTAAEPSAAPETARALASIEAAKLVVDQDIAECLDAVGDLIRITSCPSGVFAWVVDLLSREQLSAVSTHHRITVHESRADAKDQLDRTVVIWTADGSGLAIVPAGQRPADTLLNLREEIALRDQEAQQARDFQESVAAGHVEDLDAWHARTTQAPQ
ncbi:hypothetical protein ACSCBZ_42600 [Streptomyces niveiscabiei]|uniref:hypothetical protein n=1 Tax=Streptomyces niveiscabiei TaxID=164115 RepID=UPI0006EB620D|nr:hypothetical protein [Streptomyces niveiscabiei]